MLARAHAEAFVYLQRLLLERGTELSLPWDQLPFSAWEECLEQVPPDSMRDLVFGSLCLLLHSPCVVLSWRCSGSCSCCQGCTMVSRLWSSWGPNSRRQLWENKWNRLGSAPLVLWAAVWVTPAECLHFTYGLLVLCGSPEMIGVNRYVQVLLVRSSWWDCVGKHASFWSQWCNRIQTHLTVAPFKSEQVYAKKSPSCWASSPKKQQVIPCLQARAARRCGKDHLFPIRPSQVSGHHTPNDGALTSLEKESGLKISRWVTLVAPSTGWMLYYRCFTLSTALGPPLW